MSRYNIPFSPGSSHSPAIRNLSDHDKWNGHMFFERFLSELLAERQKFGPFMQVLPNCSRLLNQEIMRISSLLGTSSFSNDDPMEHGSPLTSGGLLSNGAGGSDLSPWSSSSFERVGDQGSSLGWYGGSANPTTPLLKKIVRVEVPIDRHPNFNFVGRLLGPRGNSLKRVENTTGCRVYIRGRGSIKDSVKEEKLKEKPGYEHLNEPLHVLIEAELPASIIDAQLIRAKDIIEELLKPVDESQDYYKKEQLRELAILNGTLREDSPFSPGSASSPFSNSGGMKRAKTGR